MNKAGEKSKLEIPVWPDGATESNGITAPESTIDGVPGFGRISNGIIANISEASFRIYPADSSKNTGLAILICPGGAYRIEAAEEEGNWMAEWLAENGITGIVLKYRLPNGHPEIPLKDTQEAMRIIRNNALVWGIAPNKIGICGFSAGGHLASTLLTHFDETSRPDFGILFYPRISLVGNSPGLINVRKTFLGKNAQNQEFIDYYSNNQQVKENTPPSILFVSDDDDVVPPENSLLFYQALREKSISASLHIFPEGGHGWGFHKDFRYHEQVKALVWEWLKTQRFI
ncbi:alpha/beta hydrolase [Odoribacter sp. OttesenSCG-928-J03]|nr:alpha/beta hydrolase [Odoribacter sp. OttesenSCG-928-J03]